MKTHEEQIEELFIIISTDRHRDDICYKFHGTYEKAKELCKELILEMRKYTFEEQEFYNEDNLLYSVSMLDGDYMATLYKPRKLGI